MAAPVATMGASRPTLPAKCYRDGAGEDVAVSMPFLDPSFIGNDIVNDETYPLLSLCRKTL